MPRPDVQHDALRRKARDWALRLKVEPRIIRVQHMSRKWGSCSTTGIITLAADLSFEAAEFQNFVIAHELLHLRVPNHGKLFKALMTVHVPNWRELDVCRLRLPTRRESGVPRLAG